MDDCGMGVGVLLTRPSFPVEQTAIDAGKVLTWTKGFSAKGAIGNDVVRLLQDALDKKHIHVRVSALVNDVSDAPVLPLPFCSSLTFSSLGPA
jgi:hexokinase